MSEQKLIEMISALLALDEKRALFPHGLGGHARELLTRSATALAGYDALAAQRDEGLAREAELKRQLKETPIPQEIAAELERTDWTPKQALKWYAEGKHFDVVAGRTRIIDTGHVASNALKHLSAEYLEHKGDAQLHELQQRLAEAKRLLLDVRGQLCGPDQRAIDAFLASSGCAGGEKAQ